MSRAKQLGCKFFRRSSFKVPTAINFDSEATLAISYPRGEKGVKYAFLDIFLDDVYGIASLPTCQTILDIGAHIGFFSIAARRRFPSATIHAYEPNVELLPYLQKNLATIDVDVFDEGIGLSAGKLSLTVADDSVCTRSHESANGDIAQTAFATAVERIGGTVDLLKMDCEGAEWRFLGDTASWQKVKNLRMEFHLFEREQTLAKLSSQLKVMGFEVDFVRPEGDSGILHAHRA